MGVDRPAAAAAAFGSAQIASPANTGGARRRGAAPGLSTIYDGRRPGRDWHARSHRTRPMTHLLADLRLAARSLARAPLFSLVAIVSIALGIGANTAVFTLLDQVALRPLPVRDPAALVQIHARGEETYGGTMGNGTELSWPMFLDFRDKATGFDGDRRPRVHAAARRAGRRQRAHRRRAGLGQLLRGARRASRRSAGCSRAADDRDAGRRTRWPCSATTTGGAASPAAPTSSARRVQINGQPFTVIGVAPRGFYGLELGHAGRRVRAGDHAAAARARLAQDRATAASAGSRSTPG